jgi:murein DD-endopeptidase MepM/ murein hydrolase activator NlpD
LGNGCHTYIYDHLNERKGDNGDIITSGTLLVYSWITGNSSSPHLHFEVARSGTGEATQDK